MACRRSTKLTTPPRLFVSSCGSITYKAAKYIFTILTSLVEINGYSVKNTKELVEHLNQLEVPPGQKMISYDVTALFTSIPVDKALEVITDKLEKDTTLSSRTELSIGQIVKLLDLCINTTCILPNQWVILPANTWVTLDNRMAFVNRQWVDANPYFGTHLNVKVTAGDVFRLLQARHGSNEPPGHCKVAVNDEMADWDTPVSDGDTVLLFPPVAGG